MSPRLGRESAHQIMEIQGWTVPVHQPGLTAEFGSRSLLRPDSRGVLGHRLCGTSLKSIHCPEHQLRTCIHKSSVERAEILVRQDIHLLLEENGPRVDMLVQEERSDSCPRLTVDQGPVDGSCAAVGGQQRGMEVERALGRHRPHHARQHPEGHHDEEVRIPLSQSLEELLILERLGLQQR